MEHTFLESTEIPSLNKNFPIQSQIFLLSKSTSAASK